MKWFRKIKEYCKSKSFFLSLRYIFIYFTVLFLTLNIVMIYVFGAMPDTSFTALVFTLLSLAIASHAVIIAINSDEKMKSISTGDFYELTYRFWDRAPILYNKKIKEVRDTQSWQLGNLFRHGEKLKKWADPDVQEKLIKEFKIFLKRLQPIPCEKYWVEIKNYMTICKIAIDFKTESDGIKDELIDELGNWIGKKRKGESNKEYLKRKDDEFSHKKNSDIFNN